MKEKIVRTTEPYQINENTWQIDYAVEFYGESFAKSRLFHNLTHAKRFYISLSKSMRSSDKPPFYHNLWPDLLMVATSLWGKKWQDVDCDGVVHYSQWLGFTFSEVSYDNWFRGHGISRHYPSWSSGMYAEDANPIAEWIYWAIRHTSRFFKRIKRLVAWSWAGRTIILKPEGRKFMIAAWNMTAHEVK